MPTYSTTAKLALRWLTGANPISDIDAGFQALAEDIDTRFDKGIPPLLTAVDMVVLEPPPNIPSRVMLTADNTPSAIPAQDLYQVACLVRVPRRIVSATRIRWRYVQSTPTALTGSYVLGLYNAAGTKIIDTGSVAFTGAAASVQQRSETIAATTFEAGSYYLMLGLDTTNTGAGVGVAYQGVTLAGAGSGWLPAALGFAPNLAVYSLTGGVTAPATLLAYTDASVTPAALPWVPFVALSVG